MTAIGTCRLLDITHRNRSAEFVIFIGEPEERGKGYGTEATRLMLDYAFTALGLNNLMLKVYEFNLAGQHAYRKAGFKEIGRRRQAQFMGGKRWDIIYMDCLANELESPVLGKSSCRTRCEGRVVRRSVRLSGGASLTVIHYGAIQ